MKALIAFYSRAGENYFGGAYRRISVGNTEQAARMLAAVTGADTLRIEQVQPRTTRPASLRRGRTGSAAPARHL